MWQCKMQLSTQIDNQHQRKEMLQPMKTTQWEKWTFQLGQPIKVDKMLF